MTKTWPIYRLYWRFDDDFDFMEYDGDVMEAGHDKVILAFISQWSKLGRNINFWWVGSTSSVSNSRKYVDVRKLEEYVRNYHFAMLWSMITMKFPKLATLDTKDIIREKTWAEISTNELNDKNHSSTSSCKFWFWSFWSNWCKKFFKI